MADALEIHPFMLSKWRKEARDGVLRGLAEGATVEEILRDFPTLTQDDVRATLAFAAAWRLDAPSAQLPLS